MKNALSTIQSYFTNTTAAICDYLVKHPDRVTTMLNTFNTAIQNITMANKPFTNTLNFLSNTQNQQNFYSSSACPSTLDGLWKAIQADMNKQTVNNAATRDSITSQIKKALSCLSGKCS